MTETTLSEATTALWAAANGYNGKIGEIDAAVAAIIGALSSTKRRFWVDPANGNDASVTGDLAAPLQTIQEAVDRSVDGGLLQIELMGPVHITEQIAFKVGHVIMRSQNGTRHRVTFAPQINDNSIFGPRFTFIPSLSSMQFRELEFVSSPRSPHVQQKNMIGTQLNVAVTFNDCRFTVEAGADLALFGGDGVATFVLDDTPAPDEMAGLWFEGVAANTPIADAPQVLYAPLATL
ncbi:hypothetical protein [uncultured Tateyamaria sp.]|uniref:hypothetical protein n=1 Tax=uncultured Tateyamaria sp. TaxID=455651 RepID=UPI0026366DEB|nr:hypothetical protein [uncultured Tateyamaria sp.]